MEPAKVVGTPLPAAQAKILARRHAKGETLRALAESTGLSYEVVRAAVRSQEARRPVLAEPKRQARTGAVAAEKQQIDDLVSRGVVVPPRRGKATGPAEEIVEAAHGLSDIVIAQRG